MLVKDLVSINILSYNRKQDLRLTLNKIRSQNYKDIEIIVVDNASTDNTSEMVEKEFPEVKLIKLKKNIGIEGWNEGFKAATGEFVLVLDDDAYPEDNSICLAVEEFNKDQNVACIAFNIFNLTTGARYSCNFQPDEINAKRIYWPIFIGCGVMFSMKKFHSRNIMPNDYFVYQHELPVAAEIYISGHKILYNNEIIVFHKFKSSNEYLLFNDIQHFKNTLKYINKYIPTFLAIFYNLQILLFYFTRSIKKRWFTKYIKIILENKFFVKHKKIPLEYFRELRRLDIFNFSLLSKFKIQNFISK